MKFPKNKEDGKVRKAKLVCSLCNKLLINLSKIPKNYPLARAMTPSHHTPIPNFYTLGKIPMLKQIHHESLICYFLLYNLQT